MSDWDDLEDLAEQLAVRTPPTGKKHFRSAATKSRQIRGGKRGLVTVNETIHREFVRDCQRVRPYVPFLGKTRS